MAGGGLAQMFMGLHNLRISLEMDMNGNCEFGHLTKQDIATGYILQLHVRQININKKSSL